MKSKVYELMIKLMMSKYSEHVDKRALAELTDKQARTLDEIILAFPQETDFLISVSARAGASSGAVIGGFTVFVTLLACYVFWLGVS